MRRFSRDELINMRTLRVLWLVRNCWGGSGRLLGTEDLKTTGKRAELLEELSLGLGKKLFLRDIKLFSPHF